MTSTPVERNIASATETLQKIARNVIAQLPSSVALSPGAPIAGSVTMSSGFSGASLVETDGAPGRGAGKIALLLGEELTGALAQAGLDLHSALQPALDAAARAIGLTASPARPSNPATVGALVGYPCVFIPLSSGPSGAALLLSESLLIALNPTTGDTMTEQQFPANAAREPLSSDDQQVAEPAAVPSAVGADDAPVTPLSRPDHFTPPVGIEALQGVEMEVSVELGRTRMSLGEIMSLSPGQILELDRPAGSPADLYVNGKLIARGEVVVLDDDFGLRVLEVVSAANVA